MFAPPHTRPSRQARGRWVVCLLSAALLTSCFLLAICLNPRLFGEHASSDAAPAALMNLALRDQHGAPLPSEAFAGKTLVLNFIFTRCGSVCPLQTRELARVQRSIPESLQSQVRFLSVSVDPEHDTPLALQRFAATNEIALGNWSLATAPLDATRRLTLQLGAIDTREGSLLPAAHGTAVYLFDRRGRLMQRYAGAPLDRQRLIREIEQLTQLAPSGSRTAAL